MTPPPLPGQLNQEKLRLATAANVFLPGAGVFILGHRKAGAILSGVFLVCFLGVLVLFVVGYANYLSTAFDPDILKDNKLESIGDGFHKDWLLILAAVGAVIYIVATILFKRIKDSLA